MATAARDVSRNAVMPAERAKRLLLARDGFGVK